MPIVDHFINGEPPGKFSKDWKDYKIYTKLDAQQRKYITGYNIKTKKQLRRYEFINAIRKPEDTPETINEINALGEKEGFPKYGKVWMKYYMRGRRRNDIYGGGSKKDPQKAFPDSNFQEKGVDKSSKFDRLEGGRQEWYKRQNKKRQNKFGERNRLKVKELKEKEKEDIEEEKDKRKEQDVSNEIIDTLMSAGGKKEKKKRKGETQKDKLEKIKISKAKEREDKDKKDKEDKEREAQEEDEEDDVRNDLGFSGSGYLQSQYEKAIKEYKSIARKGSERKSNLNKWEDDEIAAKGVDLSGRDKGGKGYKNKLKELIKDIKKEGENAVVAQAKEDKDREEKEAKKEKEEKDEKIKQRPAAQARVRKFRDEQRGMRILQIESALDSAKVKKAEEVHKKEIKDTYQKYKKYADGKFKKKDVAAAKSKADKYEKEIKVELGKIYDISKAHIDAYEDRQKWSLHSIERDSIYKKGDEAKDLIDKDDEAKEKANEKKVDSLREELDKLPSGRKAGYYWMSGPGLGIVPKGSKSDIVNKEFKRILKTSTGSFN